VVLDGFADQIEAEHRYQSAMLEQTSCSEGRPCRAKAIQDLVHDEVADQDREILLGEQQPSRAVCAV
jgi:hypothetical protein